MRTKRPLKKRAKPVARNEWLHVVKSLEELMEERASTETPRTKQRLIDKITLNAVNKAYAATLRYYTVLVGGGKHDPLTQRQISRLWQQAGVCMRKYDATLARRLNANNSFWSNDTTWQQETIQKAWAHLNSVRVSANRMDPELRSPFSAS